MAIKSQIRVQQVTGSIIDIAYSGSQTSATSLTSVDDGDLGSLLGQFAGAIGRISGYNGSAATGFTNAAAGTFAQDIIPEADGTRDLGSSTREWAEVHANAINSAATLVISGTTGLTLDATTVSIDGIDDSNITVTASGKDLNIGVAGGGAQVLKLDSAGTGTDAIDVNASAGGIDIDASGAISLDSSAGSIDINVVDGQTVSVGLNGAVETIWTPHATAGNEKWSTTNTAGTATDAIALTATAGGVTVDGGGGVNIVGNTAEVDITTTGALDLNSGAFTLNGSTVGIDGTSVLTLGAASMNIDSDGGAIDMDASTTVTIGGSNATGVTIGRADKNVTIPGNLIVNGTATYINTSELMVEDKQVVIGIPGGMTDPGTATYALTSDVVTVTSEAHGLTNGQYVLISDPAATPLIPEGVYLITSVADADTFTFAYVRANVPAGTAIDHSVNDVTDATASGSGIMLAPASAVPTLLKWDSTTGWLLGGPASSTAGLSPNVDGSGALGAPAKRWADLFLAEGGVINWDNGDMTMTQASDVLTVAGGDILMDTTQKITFGNANNAINLNTDLVIDAAADITLDAAGGNVKPASNDQAALGVSGTGWSDLFLADGAVIDVNAGNSTLTGGSAAWVSNVKFQATRLQVDGANDYLDVNTDFTMTAAADIRLAAGGADVQLRGSGTNDFISLQRASTTIQYMNFAADDSSAAPGVAAAGFGFRNNAGTMQFKNSAGSWQNIAAGTGEARVKDVVTVAATATAVTSTSSGFLALAPNDLDVYLNGQLMASGSGGTGNDYNVTATSVVTFTFNVEPDDTVTFVKP